MNIESIFFDIYLPKSKPIVLGILYRPPDKSDIVKHINNVFTEIGLLENVLESPTRLKFKLGISDLDLVSCTRKTSSLNFNKHNYIFIGSMKNYTKENFFELLRKTDFPD